MNNVFNPGSKRAREAGIRRVMQKLKIFFAVTVVLALLMWIYQFFFLHMAVAWLWLMVAVLVLMMLVWGVWGIKHIPVGKSGDINDLLSGDAMLVLKRHQGDRKMLEALRTKTKSGRFLALRLVIPASLVQELVPEGQNLNMEEVFERAREVRKKVDSSQIGGGDLFVAAIVTAQNHEAILKKYDIDTEDLYNTLRWFNYLYSLAQTAKKPIRTGGIARDLNFGYIPTLQQYAKNISTRSSRSARSQLYYTDRGEALEKMVKIFSGDARQNVALIGPEGSGRSLIVKAFAEELLDEDSKLPRSLRYRQVFQLNASALLSAVGGERGSLERLLTKIFNEAYAARNVILYFNDAQLFFKEGMGSIDMTNFLMPVIEEGRLRIILSIEEQEFLQMSMRNSGVANLFNRVNIAPTDEAGTMRVLEDQVPGFEGRFGVFYTYGALQEAYKLGDRYINDRSEPGRALRMLEIGAEYAKDGVVTRDSVRTAVEKNLGIKTKVADTADDREKLLNLEELIHERMVNQKAAVKTVAAALQRAAAGVRNQNRPIGTFLFLGPTGVGKTELAKALSEVYFEGEGNIVRLDLNEFVNAEDVTRLVADGADDEMSLTAQVMKKPFSIVLLDEIEKAHPQVLTALLQVLDEGILRDVKNREVSFRDTIIVATSNAGADEIRRYIAEGEALDKVKDKLMDLLIERREFKPEFLNRFDEVCVFTPLSKDDLLKVADIMIASTNKTLAGQKIEVKLTGEAKAVLVEHGYDPQLGARPMRRVIQKTVENLVAKAVLSGQAGKGTVLEIGAEEIRGELEGE